MTILSASDKDDNSSALRLMIRDTGQIGFSVKNDGGVVVDIYTEETFRDEDTGDPDEWHHVAVIVDDNGTEIFVDGNKKKILASTGSVDARGFFSDVQNIDSITLGRHFCSNPDQTEIFEGRLDEVYLFDRVLSAKELQYMIDEATLNTVVEAKLVPSIDAVGTLKLIDGGSGYREIPRLSFVGTHTGGDKGMAMAEASLVPTKLDDLAFVDFQGVPLVDSEMSTDEHGMLAQFITGFRLPPTITIELSPSIQDEDAAGKGLFFIPEVGGYEITNSGSGFLAGWTPANDQAFVISGRGCKPPVFEPLMEADPHHDGFFRIAGVRLKERGYGPYDNNTTYLLPQYGANGKVDYWYLDPLFITGGNLAGPTYPDGSSSSRYQGDSGTANYPTDTYPAKLKVNVADAADVTAGLASASGDIMSMEVVSGGKYTNGPPGPPNAQDIVGGVGYREAPDIDLSGLVPEHRLAVDSSKVVIHQVLDRVTLTDRGKGYRKPLEVSWHGGYFPEDNVSLVTYPRIVGVEIDENGSISSISAESNASTNVTNWENLFLSITGAGGTGASASIGLSWLGGPIVEMNGSNATVVTDWFGQAVGIFERNQTSTGFHYDGWNQLFAFDGNLTNDNATQYTVAPFWDWIAIPESNVTSTWVNGLTVGGIQYYWDDTNGSLYRFVDTARTLKTYFDGNGSVSEAYGKLQVTMNANGSGYNPPGDTNQSLSNGLVLGVDVNATLQATWNPPGPAIEKNATFDVKLGGSLQSISPLALGRGSGYVGPKVDLKGDGTGAILHAVVKGGRIEKIVVEDSGKGYNEANVSIAGGGGLDFDGKPFSKESGNQLIEANCTALIMDGKIISVRVDDPGWGYFQPEIVVTGSGSGVEAVPVIGDYKIIGNITVKDGILGVFIIDPGSGFTERPWLNEQPVVHVLDYTSSRSFDFMEASLRSSLVDNTGDRIGEITITDGGSYDKRDLLSGEITLNYPVGENETDAFAIPYFDRVLKELAIYDPTGRSLTIPGTDFLMLGVYGSDSNGIAIVDGNGDRAVDVNSSFLERPEISFNQASDFNAILQSESPSLVNVFGNGRDYNATRSHNYVDVYVGNDFPEESFYHLRDYMGLSTGGRVLVKDAVPGSDWWNIFEWEANHHYAAGQVVLFPPRITGEPQIAYEATSTHFSGGSFPGIESGVWRDLTTDKDFIDGKAAVYTGSTWGYVSEGQETYTDSQGYYSFNDLEPGLYNLTVFHEDESLQTISYQVAGSRDAITQTVALKGIPELVLEASGEKDGNCTLVWSQKTISEADVGSNATMLKGVGLGFGQKPALMLLPDSQNTGQGTLDLNDSGLRITLTADGRLDLQVVSAAFHDRVDKYYLRYRASSSGVDFWVTDWNASGVTPNHLTISPDSAANAIEAPVFAFTPGDLSKEFNATVWDTNSNIVQSAPITWSWVTDIPRDRNQTFPLKSSENNNSEIAVQNADDSLTLYSTLRKGRLLRVDVLDGGYGYSSDINASKLVFAGSSGKGAMVRIAEVNGSGSITRIEVLDPGEGYFDGVLTLSVTDSAGSGAFLLPVLGSGRITIRAQLDSNASIFAEANATAAALHVLDSNASWSWLDRYFDTFNTVAFDIIRAEDNDSDGLSNQQELLLFTNPNWSDTDGDGLDDHNESQTLGTNALVADTDSDGLTDYQELTQYNTNATKFDTDGDGWNDGLEVAYGLSPTQAATGTGYVSGTVYFHGNLTGKLYLTPFIIDEGSGLTTPYHEFNPAQASYYFFNNLQTGNTNPYAFFAFIDRNGNKIFDNGEPSGSYLGTWGGLLTGNRPQINITVFDPAPKITIFGSAAMNLSPGDSFTDPGIFAYDAWEGEILPVVRSGNATTVMDVTDYNSTSGATDWLVRQSSPPGIYHLVYSAVDSSESTGTATRILTIRDIVPPTISLTGSSFVTHEAVTSFQDPGYSAYDSLDGDLTANVNVTVFPIVTEQEPIGTKLESYSLSYSVSDSSGNVASSVTRTVKVVDTTKPVITLSGGSTVNVNRGSSFQDPGYAAYDSLDGDLTENVTIDGLASLDLNQTGSHSLTYNVLDSSSNLAQVDRTIYVADWNFTLAGKAMDGYLVGASVIFDTNGDGIHDLSAAVQTDQSGAFSIAFTNEEFAVVDSNLNGVIDPGEGRIKVSGGIDSSTMEPFTGSYQADANSSVVTPLTSLVAALLDEGLSRESAKSKVAETMGVSTALDISNYDAIAAAAQGDSASAPALAASARVANAIRQTAAFLDFVSDGNVTGQSSSFLLLSEVAKKIASGGLSPLGDANEMKTALDTIVIGSGYADRVTDADILGAAQLSARADEMIVEASSTIAVPHSLASELAKIQAVIEDSVVSGYDKLRLEGGTAAALSESLTKDLLSGQTESFSGVNVFPPVASNGETALPSDRHATGSVVFSVAASDADGDSIQYSITIWQF